MTISQPLLSDGVTRDPGWLAIDDLVYSAYDPDRRRHCPGEPRRRRRTLRHRVPEPSAWALMILGFGGVGALTRRSRRADLAVA